MTDQRLNRRAGKLAGLSALALILAVVNPSMLFADGDEESDFPGGAAITDELREAREKLDESARARRLALIDQSFEEFRDQTFREPGEGGKFIVNGDTSIANEKQLLEYFAQMKVNAMQAVDPTKPELAVNTSGGLDTIWSNSERQNLTYCISTSFGSKYQETVDAMRDAADAWEAAADINFIYLPQEDSNCTASNNSVVFDVRPVFFGRYLARAFFPNDGRAARNVLIDNSSFNLDPTRNLTLVGILRHELGHVIGLRHEHTRPDSGTCFEDQNWRPVTDYDAFSVMHYPQCNGAGDWSLTLTHFDRNGIACLYGAADGFIVDTGVCQPPQPGGDAKKELKFEDIAISQGEEWEPAGMPVLALPGSEFSASITGTGDPDLYLKFDTPANRADYDCRPYTDGAEEECLVDVPAGASRAYVMVRGYEAGQFSLTVSYTSP